VALGEGLFPVSGFPRSSSPTVALGEGFPECNRAFPECNRHSWKPLAPVVRTKDLLSKLASSAEHKNIYICSSSLTSKEQ
jgi:hypothetical protein